ncbi:MAG: histidine phosphatase family protein [Actinobacteria bacterium]|nr:histidine phosphatase family protein [Actinomycetota bacterium]
MATLVFVRHGETDWNRDHRWQGFTGPPLNETGRSQTAELAAQLEHIDAIYGLSKSPFVERLSRSLLPTVPPPRA